MLKIRSTKSETRNKSEIQNPNNQNGCRRYCNTGVLDFDFWSFEFVSDFDSRISDLTPYKQIAYRQHSTQQHVSCAVVLLKLSLLLPYALAYFCLSVPPKLTITQTPSFVNSFTPDKFPRVSPFFSRYVRTAAFLLCFYFVKVFSAGFTKLHLSLMRRWMQAMTFADTRIGKGSQTIVGCPRGGAKIFLILEVTIIEIEGINAARKFDPAKGLNLLSYQF